MVVDMVHSDHMVYSMKMVYPAGCFMEGSNLVIGCSSHVFSLSLVRLLSLILGLCLKCCEQFSDQYCDWHSFLLD